MVGGFEPEAKPWVAPDRDPVPVRVPAARRGLGALLGADGRGRAPHPGARARPGSASSTTAPRASRRTTSSCWARRPGCAASSSAPASTRSASRRPAAPGGRWPSGSSQGEPTSGPGRRSTCAGSRRSTPTHAVAARAGRRRSSACTTPCRGRTASSRPAATSGCSPLHDRLAAAGARASAPRWAGSGRTSSRPPERPALDYAWGKPRVAAVVGAPSSAPRRTAVAVFDQTSFSQVRRRRARRARRAAVGLRRRRRRAGRARASTRRCSTRAAPTRPTSPSPAPAPTSSCWSAARPPRCATWTGSGGTSPTGAEVARRRRHRRVRRARRDGAALARAAGAARPTRDLVGRRRSRSRPAGSSTSAAAAVRATRMTYVGELAGS